MRIVQHARISGIKHVVCDHVTCDMLHGTCGMGHVACQSFNLGATCGMKPLGMVHVVCGVGFVAWDMCHGALYMGHVADRWHGTCGFGTCCMGHATCGMGTCGMGLVTWDMEHRTCCRCHGACCMVHEACDLGQRMHDNHCIWCVEHVTCEHANIVYDACGMGHVVYPWLTLGATSPMVPSDMAHGTWVMLRGAWDMWHGTCGIGPEAWDM